jgi:hypothetical protein
MFSDSPSVSGGEFVFFDVHKRERKLAASSTRRAQRAGAGKA